MEQSSPAPVVIPSSRNGAGSPLVSWKAGRWRSASKMCMHCGHAFRPWSKVLNGQVRVMQERLWNRQQFCSRSCSKRHSNPMISESVRRKVSASLKARHHRPSIQGGNGRALPRSQQALLAILGPSWIPEFVVPTRTPKGSGWPTHYKIDLANPETRLAIEIDGHCHNAIIRQQQDRRKTAFLAERGWCVLRITNKRALSLSITCTSPDILLISLMEFLSTTAI